MNDDNDSGIPRQRTPDDAGEIVVFEVTFEDLARAIEGHQADAQSQAIARAVQTANETEPHLHPEQRRITFGDFYVYLYGLTSPDPADHLVIFGMVGDPDTLEANALLHGVDPADVVAAKLLLRSLVETHHLLLGVGYSVDQPRGFKAKDGPLALGCWPITPEVYAAAMEAGWDPARMAPGARAHLDIAVTAYKAHMAGVRL